MQSAIYLYLPIHYNNIQFSISSKTLRNNLGEFMSNEQNPSGILTPKQLTENYPAFTSGGIRHLIFNAEKNGFSKCIRRVGRKILILEPEFLSYIENEGK